MKVYYDKGTILVEDLDQTVEKPDYLIYDSRIKLYRAPAYKYMDLKKHYSNFEDSVFENSQAFNFKHSEKLRGYQKEAVNCWLNNGANGVIVLPTAAGKTHIGIDAISLLSTSTLVIAPTIELIHQWRDKLASVFGTEIGQIGGGLKELKPITISTFDSAYLMAERLGNKFKFLLVDEVHHLAASQFIQIAKLFASPYRLGLTATYERTDLLHKNLEDVMGGKIFEMGYEELSEFLSDYQIIRIPVDLTPEEEEEYEKNRTIFLRYLRKHRIQMRGPWDFEKFILSSWNPEGREALLAWRTARSIAFSARVKIDAVRYVLSKHANEKTLIFSEDTDTAYLISREFLVPALTYLTPGEERKKYLSMFKDGTVTALATSRVLDEGVDVPDASIAIVLSGSGSTRQFRQRLGRILRPQKNKKAILYEIVAKKTSEYNTSKRRRKGVPDSVDDVS